jgi:hypothetical protein
MKLFFLSFLVLLSFQIGAQTITRFESEADVLVYLNNKADFTNKNNGVTLTFFDMGGRMRSNKGVSYYNPDVSILSSTRAVVVYESLTSGGVAKIIVDCRENVIADKSDMTVYSPDNSNEIQDDRPARSIRQNNTIALNNPKKITSKPIKIGKLLVATNDFPGTMNWADANKAVKTLGAGWRLPSKEEALILYKNKSNIGGFNGVIYWTATTEKPDPRRGKENEKYAWVQFFDNWRRAAYEREDAGNQVCFNKSEEQFNIRPVKSL